MAQTTKRVYDAGMSSRPTPANLAPPAAEWIDEPITDADWAVLSEADRLAIEEAEAAVARGEWVPHEVAMAKLDAMIAEFSAKCRS